MKKITSGSKAAVMRLFTPPTSKSGIDEIAPRGLTIRRLMRWKKYRDLRERATIALTYDGHLVCIHNLKVLGFDFIG